jgi:hypothetical protein
MQDMYHMHIPQDGPLSMNTWIKLLRSLTLAGIFGFLLPILPMAILLLVLAVAEQMPILHTLSQAWLVGMLQFLQIFGNGSVFHGLLILGTVCGTVGIFFDTYTHYRAQKLNTFAARHGTYR